MFLESTTVPPPRKRRVAEGGPLPPRQCGSGRPAGLRARQVWEPGSDWYTITLAHPKTLADTKTLAHPKTLAHTKTLEDTKTLAHPKTLADTKTLAHPKTLHKKHWRIPKLWLHLRSLDSWGKNTSLRLRSFDSWGANTSLRLRSFDSWGTNTLVCLHSFDSLGTKKFVILRPFDSWGTNIFVSIQKKSPSYLFFKLWSQGIDSKEPMLLANAAWARICKRFKDPRNRFQGTNFPIKFSLSPYL